MTFHLSRHTDVENLGRGFNYKKGWEPFTAPMHAVASTASRFAWSPCQWFGGHRLTANFGRANLVALDFDSGEMTLEHAHRIFCDSVHVIGTTKSHRKDKGGIACDRFRVILALDHEVTDAGTFAATARFYALKYDADTQAADAARFFWPCHTIVSVNDDPDAYRQEIIRPDPTDRGPPPQRYRQSGVVRRRSHSLLSQPIPSGQRNNFCFTVSKDLYDAGYTYDEIYRIIVSSPTYQGSVSPPVSREIDECIRSAIKSVDAGKAYNG